MMLYVTVKTFPKIRAFFCKGLPACMHIGHGPTSLSFGVVYQHQKTEMPDYIYC